MRASCCLRGDGQSCAKEDGDINSKISSLHRLTGDEDAVPKIEVDLALRNYQQSLDALLQALKARILPYPLVGHEQLVRRALVPSKPFVEGGRGYRDALIWYSLVELLQSTTCEVVFVSQNSND